jgi:hypothetical protein
MELPSYTAHVRDRVANMFLPQSATMRVSNPWIQSGVSPTLTDRASWPLPVSTQSHSRGSSPLESHVLSYFPDAPGSGSTTPFNPELLLSLADEATPSLSRHTSSPDSYPRRELTRTQASSRPRCHSSLELYSTRSLSDPLAVPGPNEIHVHSGRANSSLHSLLHVPAKLFSSLPRPGWLSSRSNSRWKPTSPSSEQSRQQTHLRWLTMPAQNRHLFSVLHRAFTEVPDYSVASRGFIGGVPPLTSMRGLPSYAEAEISRNTS